MTINIDSKKEAILKKIFGVDDLAPVIEKVISDWADMQISLRAGNEQTIDEKITVLDSKIATKKVSEPILGAIKKTKKLK